MSIIIKRLISSFPEPHVTVIVRRLTLRQLEKIIIVY